MSLERVVADLAEKVEHRFYGKYRGIVKNNQDPAKLGRLRLSVPSVLGSDVVTGWATPCAPYGGAADVGFLFIPDVGAGVWAEFEEGDLEFPIWSGSFWSQPNSTTELPKPNQGSDGSEESGVQDPPTSKIIKTAKGHTLQFEDGDGVEMILLVEGVKGHFLSMDANGITVTDANKNSIQFRQAGITVTDTNNNTIKMTSDGISVTDTNNNTIEMTSQGISVTDANNNAIQMSSTGFTITAVMPFKIDASGQTVTIVGSAIDFQQG
jgi:uncharacterized protein involved in type VI secretion and phage assembly